MPFQHREFRAHDRLPPSWLDAGEEYVSTMVSGNFVLELNSLTSVKIMAGAGNDQVTVGISGKLRYNTATVTRTHPGGGAGEYDVYLTGSANAFSLNPSPPPIDLDTTVYSFGLFIPAMGALPTTAIYRKCGYVIWDGTKIVTVVQTIGTSGYLQPGSVYTGGIGDAPLDGSTILYSRADHKHLITYVEKGAHGSRAAVGTRGRLYYNTTKDEIQRDNGTAWRTANRPLVLTVAEFGAITGAEDGDEVGVLVDPDKGTVWRLVYRAASASPHKWECVGGPPLIAEATASLGVASAAYSGTGPNLVVPRAGEYEIEMNCDLSFAGGSETIADAVVISAAHGEPPHVAPGPPNFHIGQFTYAVGRLYFLMVHHVNLNELPPPPEPQITYGLPWKLLSEWAGDANLRGHRLSMYWGIGQGQSVDTAFIFPQGTTQQMQNRYCLVEIPSGFDPNAPIGSTNQIIDTPSLSVPLANNKSRVIVMKIATGPNPNGGGAYATEWEGGWTKLHDEAEYFDSFTTAYGPTGDSAVTWDDDTPVHRATIGAEIKIANPGAYYMSYDIGNTPASDQNAARTAVAPGLTRSQMFRARPKELPAAALTARYRKSTNLVMNAAVENRIMLLRPRRVS